MEKEQKKILCECGFFVRWDCLNSHKNTKKHQKFMSNNQDIQDNFETILKKMILQTFQEMITNE